MSTLGLGRAPASQQGSVQGIMGQQRINPMQGGGMGPLNMSRSNTIGLQQGAGGQPGYGPSGV